MNSWQINSNISLNFLKSFFLILRPAAIAWPPKVCINLGWRLDIKSKCITKMKGIN